MKTIKSVSSLMILTLLLMGNNATAQEVVPGLSVNDKLGYWLLGGVAAVFLGLTIYVFRTALSVLHENGKSMEFSFPMIRKMSQNGKAVTIVILIIVLSAITWAVSYSG